jgi:signal transduction histidine kinase
MPIIPLPENEEDRLAALRSYNILDTAEETDFDELTILASAICQTPIALITLLDDKRQWFKSHPGVAEKETPKELSFCVHAIVESNDIMVVNDATRDERFANNPLVTGDTKVIFYAGVPLVNEDGFALGSLCVIDHQHKELTEIQTNALKIIAKQVITKLELRRKAITLDKLHQQLITSNVFIEKFASMAAHDIKNPLSSMLLSSQALKMRLKNLENDGCERLIDLNISSTNRLMALLDEMLAYSKSPELLMTKKKKVYLNSILEQVLGMINVPAHFKINTPPENHLLNVSVVALEQIFINLITNAIRYNDKENGLINIRFSDNGDNYHIEIEDNGMGIAKQYHKKIFGANFTLKVPDRFKQKGSGIGLSTVRDLIKALNGSISLQSVPGEGTIFFIAIPKA